MTISKLAQVLNGLVQNVDLTTEEIQVASVRYGGGAGTLLTKTILDNLITLQNGSDFSTGTNSHTHDGRYFTETEIGQASGTTGSDLVGDDNSYSNFTPAAATVKGALSGIDTALSSIGDGKVKISSNDTTKDFLENKIVSANAMLTIATLNDGANEDLQLTVVNSAIDHGALSGLGDDDHTIYVKADGTRAFSGNQAMGGNKLTGLGEATANGDAVRYEQLTALESLINNFEWQESVIDQLTTPPGSPSTGDRYLVIATATGAWAGQENKIAEYNGSSWVFTTPSTGMYVSVDDESDGLYLYGGSSWTKKYFEATTASTGLTKVGFDVRLDASAGGDGLTFTSGVLAVGAGDGIDVAANAISVDVSDLAGTGLENDGSNNLRIAASAAGDGLSGGAGSALSVNVDSSTIEINTDTLRVKDLGISTAKLADASVTADKLAAAVAGNGLTGGAGSALAVGAGTGISVAADAVSVDYAPLVKKSMVAGESFAADTSFLVRWAVTGETAGRVYKATNAAAAADGKFWAHGILLKGSAVSDGDSADVVCLGSHTLGASDTAFGAGDVGKAVWLTTGGAFSVTAPSSSGTASYKVGTVESTTKIWVGSMQLTGIN